MVTDDNTGGATSRAGSPLGTALADRYRIELGLGAGGMVTVSLGHDVEHKRDVAIKVLDPLGIFR